MKTLTKVLNMLTDRVKQLAMDDINKANVSQIWGLMLLFLVMVLSPVLIIMAKNAISSIQVKFSGFLTVKIIIFPQQTSAVCLHFLKSQLFIYVHF